MADVIVDMNKICVECRKGGAVQSGICLGCTNKAIKGKPMKSAIGRAVQVRFRENILATRKSSATVR